MYLPSFLLPGKSARRPLLVGFASLGLVASALSAEPLRMVVGTMSYPLERNDRNGQITGGLIKDMGELLAAELGTRVVFVSQSRRRVEPSLLSGEIDISCYSHPSWWDSPQPTLWSIPTIPQIERIVGLRSTRVAMKAPEEFSGKRVVVHTGYHFPTLQPLFDSGKAKRLDESQVELMFKAVETGLSDVLITSDAEIAAYFDANPAKRQTFAVASEAFSVIPTQCALSPRSTWSLEQIDRALGAMMKRGDFDRLTGKYGMTMR